jgi:hypothetical protein
MSKKLVLRSVRVGWSYPPSEDSKRRKHGCTPSPMPSPFLYCLLLMFVSLYFILLLLFWFVCLFDVFFKI